MMFDKEKVISESEILIRDAFDVGSLKEKRDKITKQIDDIQKKLEALNTVAVQNSVDRDKYEKEFLTLENEYLTLMNKEKEITKKIKDIEANYESAIKVLEIIRNRKEFFKEFEKRIWIELLDRVTVKREYLLFELKNNFRYKVFLNEISS